MREHVISTRKKDPRITYRGSNPTRLDALTDTVFGIAITLLIFNLNNPNSFQDLVLFTKTLPAFLISIGFLMIIWSEHVNFSRMFGPSDSWYIVLHTIFLALIIFYVYPLRFLMLYLTNFFFTDSFQLDLSGNDVPELVIYYGFILFGLNFVLFLFYARSYKIRNKLALNPFEAMFTKAQCYRMVIMFGVPLISIGIAFLLRGYSVFWASFLGGMTYFLYTPLILIWARVYNKKEVKYSNSGYSGK